MFKNPQENSMNKQRVTRLIYGTYIMLHQLYDYDLIEQ